ncbi:ABC transporter family substrate-binding protein [Aeromicrobium chenweiae]|uniref:Solute-binding protein family 5 domain-containing protein n=1 Tax=Aeromicrobium chenweiae TaxID=2079793 RepID=A0A2S0WRD8_9ACTN|nr:ABC transporter family substrate-binding protein [Aeromicrobium chenweiae]AWB93925.1 hypothetical protein C3E78_17855 [Aeromicrobium chenweiae]TGN30970.1 ABC transporter family substrate-binding protein [Aeromicrobium chenweiae]
MRSPLASAASLLLAGSLLLSGCTDSSSGESDQPPAAASSTTTSTPADQALPSTAWRDAPPADVAPGGTLRLAASTLPTNFNPLQVDSANSDAARILAPTTGSAIRITADGGWTVDPDYARSVEVVDKDPLTVKVDLNRDAVWQGGTSITAQDMVAFWKAQNGSDDAFEVVSTAGYDAISAVTPGKDQFSYTVTFDEPTAEWPLYVYPRLAKNVSSSPKLFNQGFRKRAISANGPYVVSSIDTRKGLIVQRPNPRWWGDKPKLSRITWNIADADLQAEAYVNGGLDAVDLQASTYARAKGTGVVQRAAGIEWSQVTLNAGRGALKDVEVRRAVAHAINPVPIAVSAAKPLGARPAPLGSLLLLPGQRGYRDSSGQIAYDPDRAARLLDRAGYRKGADGMRASKDGTPLRLVLPVPAETPTNSARAKAIAADLEAVGIRVRTRSAPSGMDFYEKIVIPLDFDLVTFQRRGSAFPLTAAKPLFYPIDSAQNFTGIGPRRIGAGFDTVLGTLNEKLRIKRIAKLDEWLLQEAPVVPLAVTPIVVAVRKDLANYGAAQFEQPDWTRVGFTKKG